MELDTKFVFFSIIFIILLSGAELRLSKRFAFFNTTDFLIRYLFPKEPNLLRVRNSEEARAINKVTTLDFIGLVEKHGYPSEEHYVTTEDGYNLKLHRMPDSPLSNNKQNKIVVLLMHGILCSSDTWVLYGANKDLAFLLTDEGYDVWFGNFRGNSYCRSHVKMSTYDPKFWEYSYHEIGTKDLPATIDYILNYTKSETLYYIGYSMGSTSLLALLSMKPEYNAKIKLGICLAPVVFWKETSPVLKFIFSVAPPIKKFLDNNNIYDLAPLSSTSITAGRTLCRDYKISQVFCVKLLFSIAGSDPLELNTTTLPEIFSHFPDGTSVRSLVHYSQNSITGNFQTFDYGNLSNYERYKQPTPVKYNIKKITVPIALFYGVNDQIVPKANVLYLHKQLPNVILLEEVPNKLFSHLDFLWSINAKVFLYDRVIQVMQKFESDSNR